MHKENFPSRSVIRPCWRRHSHSSDFGVLIAALASMILLFPGFLLPLLSLLLRTFLSSSDYISQFLKVCSRGSPHSTLQSGREEKRTKKKRRPKKKGHRSGRRTLYQKIGGKAELRGLVKSRHMKKSQV